MANSELYITDNGTQSWRPLLDTDLNATVNATIGAVTLDGGKPTSSSQALAITAKQGGGGDQALGATYTSLYVGAEGDAVVTMSGGGDATFKSIPAGTILPISITDVKQTGTTASDMVALK